MGTNDLRAGHDLTADDVEIVGEPAAAPVATAGEMERLRFGVAALAGLLAIFHVLFALLGSTTHPEAVDSGFGWLLSRVAVDAAVAALALSPWGRDRRVLRVLEGLLIVAEALFLVQSQYRTVLSLIEARDFVDAVAVQKNGVLRTLILVIAAAVFLPHGPATTARIAVSLAAAIILCHGLVLHHANTEGVPMDDVANRQIVMTSALFLIMAGVVATALSWLRHATSWGGGEAKGFSSEYSLVRFLGTRGTGDVYLAEQRFLGRPCAVKVVHADRNPAEELDRFERESRAASLLRHPAAVAILDAGRTEDGSAYCAMEYLPGLSLALIVEQFGPLDPGRAVFLARQMCGALGEAHRQGLLHGNVAPTNVFVSVLGGECDVAKVVDFGVRTRASDFIAPEQAAGGRADGRADLFGLGALLAFMLTGSPPGPPGPDGRPEGPRARRPDLPADLDAVVTRLIAGRPEDRYADAAAVAAALEGCRCASGWGQAQAERWWRGHVGPGAAGTPDHAPRE